MKRLRTWAWAAPETVQRQMVRTPWGSAYWKHKFMRRQAAMRQVRLIPVVRVGVPGAEHVQDDAAKPPVVH